VLRITKLAVSHDSSLSSFISNLKEFLKRRPVKGRPEEDAPFVVEKFGSNLGFGAFWENFKSAFAKGAPKGVDVPDIWTKDSDYARSQAFSLAIHVVLIVLVAIPLWSGFVSPLATTKPRTMLTPLEGSPFVPKLPAGNKKAGGGGGGGEHNPVQASMGKLARTSVIQFTPPSAHPPEAPKLQMTPTIIAMPDIKIPSPDMSKYGDPLMKSVSDSNGPGGDGGIGSGRGTGVGPGEGNGVGPGHGWNYGDDMPMAGTGGYGQPACVYCPQPPFSDEAVRAKYQTS
jgi:hypothetical protein